MVFSMRAIAVTMDSIAPPVSLRELHRRYSWTNASQSVSLQAITRRHSKTSATLHFLSYNTFLLPGIDITYDLSEVLLKAGLTAADALQRLSLEVGEFLATLGRDAVNDAKAVLKGIYKTPLNLAKALGIDLGLLSDFVQGALDIVDVLTFGVFNLAEQLTFDLLFEFLAQSGRTALDALRELGIGLLQVLEFLSIDPLEALVQFVVVTGRLLGIDIPYPVRVGAKPALQARAWGIGKTCERLGYDLMAYSEVFDQDPSARAAITSAWRGSSRALNLPSIGASDPNALTDSGLLHLCLHPFKIVETRAMVFKNRGDRLLDTDAWSSKGALLSRIDVGVGVIDLYNTHLISGGDLLGNTIAAIASVASSNLEDSIRAQFSSEAQNAKRLLQIDELIEWIRATHNPRNIALICGDFNIDAEAEKLQETDPARRFPPTPTYTALVNKFQNLQVSLDGSPVNVSFYDLFAHQRAYRPKVANFTGSTHGPEDTADRFINRCDVITDLNNRNAGFCDERKVYPIAARIDYLFVEAPTAHHTFTLDLTRLRRIPFTAAGLPDDQKFLSDHIGYDVTLIANA